MQRLVWALCGVCLFAVMSAQAFNAAPRIINGSTAEPGDYPWQVGLMEVDGDQVFYFCGGAIIDARWILTAAHCLEGMGGTNLQIWSGGTDIQSIKGDNLMPATGFRIHTEYVPQGSADGVDWDNDIAVIKLTSPLQLVDGKRETIKWLSADNASTVSNGSDVLATGWGITDNSGTQPRYLQSARMIIDDCAGWGALITENMLCAHNNDYTVDSCRGDSGSALVLNGSGTTPQIAGLVSWGADQCANGENPGVYTRVSAYDDWIINALSRETTTAVTGKEAPIKSGEPSKSSKDTLIGAWTTPAGWLYLVVMSCMAGIATVCRIRAAGVEQ